MAGFVWRHELVAEAGGRGWRFLLATKRRWYSQSFWDEQVTMRYLNGEEAGSGIDPYCDLLQEDLEQVVFVAHLHDGGILQVEKDGSLHSYWFIAGGHAYWLAADFAPVVQIYITEAHVSEWLIEQIRVLSVS